MRRLMDKESLEAVVGAPRQAVMMKQIAALDEQCCALLARVPVAGFGFRDHKGLPQTTFIGGEAGFVCVESPDRISFAVADEEIAVVPGAGVSFVFLLPGVGEMLRMNGSVSARSEVRITVSVEEAFVHCARAILRSGLWKAGAVVCSTSGRAEPLLGADADTPLQRSEVADFLASSPFLVVSSWDRNGASDTSPRGDSPGFVRVLNGRMLAIPDRKGNRRTDTFHNLLTCNAVSLAALVPGRCEVLQIRGTAHVTDEPELLATMAVGKTAPHAALIVCVDDARVTANRAVRMSRMWEREIQLRPSSAPDLMVAATHHIAHSQRPGARAGLMRWLSRVLAAFPALMRRMIDRGYRRALQEEGYDDG